MPDQAENCKMIVVIPTWHFNQNKRLHEGRHNFFWKGNQLVVLHVDPLEVVEFLKSRYGQVLEPETAAALSHTGPLLAKYDSQRRQRPLDGWQLKLALAYYVSVKFQRMLQQDSSQNLICRSLFRTILWFKTKKRFPIKN